MRHVLEKLNYANRSMKHKLVLYMAAMGLLLAAVLLVSLQIFGRINTPDFRPAGEARLGHRRILKFSGGSIPPARSCPKA